MALLHPSHLIDYDNTEQRRHAAINCEVRSSPQLGGERTEEIFLKQLQSVARGSRYVELEQQFNSLRDQLAMLRFMKPEWDINRTPVPNDVAISAAESALGVLRSLNALPTDILPSADGGIGICFIQNGHYAHIEFENSGEIWALMYGPETPAATWQLPSDDVSALAAAWDNIRANLQS